MLSEYWRDAVALDGSITTRIWPRVVGHGVISAVVWIAAWVAEARFGLSVGLEISPHEMVGVALGLLLVLRMNSGYDRWWEARKLWGGVVNQSRNLASGALAYGPADPDWRRRFVRWTAVFPHVLRCSLRGEPPCAEVEGLIGPEGRARVQAAQHMPLHVALTLAELLREARDLHGMDSFAFVQLDRERAQLVDHLGACERILKTPLPEVSTMKIRRFIALFLVTLPFALLPRLKADWMIPFVTMMVAYPLLAVDQTGVELENPFSTENLSHLPLKTICATIEGNLMALLDADGVSTAPSAPVSGSA